MGKEILTILSGPLADQEFDVVLMDIEMPVMDGIAATRVIRKREQQEGGRIPIIAVTSTDTRDECLAGGIDAFLPKPLDPQALEVIVDRLICTSAA